jgi:hypothetical protein
VFGAELREGFAWGRVSKAWKNGVRLIFRVLFDLSFSEGIFMALLRCEVNELIALTLETCQDRSPGNPIPYLTHV